MSEIIANDAGCYPLLGNSSSVGNEDPIFSLQHDYRQDTRSTKLDLGIGVYRGQNNTSPIFTAVKQAEQWRIDNEIDKAYIGPLGDRSFCESLSNLILGEVASAAYADRLAYAQTPGGVGALKFAFELFYQANPKGVLWLSDTTWQVHCPIASGVGLTIKHYPYYQSGTGRLPFDRTMATLASASAGDAILLQAGCHNPTGLDFTEQQWLALADFCQQKGVVPIIDMAYHGLGLGLELERFGVLSMASAVPELLLCYTCSKNFGLYRERTGMLMALACNSAHRSRTESQLMQLATRSYFTPPAHGASLVDYILRNDTQQQLWLAELEQLRLNLKGLRKLVADTLTKTDFTSNQSWDFLHQGNGMFALFPFSYDEIEQLKKEYGIYIVNNGRVNLSGQSTVFEDVSGGVYRDYIPRTND